MANFYEDIVEILVDVADLAKEDISEDSQLIDDLDLASLEIMSVISKLESKYSIKISENELLSVATVEDLINLIQSK